MYLEYELSKDVKNKYFLKDELINHIVKLKMLGAKLCILTGDNLYSLQDDIVKILPDLRIHLPVRIKLDYDSTSLVFLKKTIHLVNGYELDIKIPLKQSYTEEEKIRFKEIYSPVDINIFNYRDNILNVISLIDDLKLTTYNTFKDDRLTYEDISYMLLFSKELNGDYFLI